MTKLSLRAKGSDRIQINNLLSAICIGVLTVLLSLSQNIISEWVLVQISCAIPALIISSLSYAKISYRNLKEIKKWDYFGWGLHIFGYLMIINSLLLLLYQKSEFICFWIFLIFTYTIYLVYSVLDIINNIQNFKEKIIKICFFSLFLFSGSILPILEKWINK